MRLLFFSLFVLVAVVTLALLAHRDPGYVLIGHGYTTLELSLSLFIVLLLLTIVASYMLLRLIFNTLSMPKQLRSWRRSYQARKARAASNDGLVELAQGHWHEAEKMLTKYAAHSDTPLLNYLSAAHAAQKLNAPQRRDQYLSLAHSSMRGADFAVELTQAELQMAHGQLEQSLATLMHLQSISPKHTHVLFLLVQIYKRLKSWNDLKALLPALRKNKVFNEKQLRKLEKTVWHELFLTVVNEKKSKLLKKYWETMPRNLRKDEDLINIYASGLIIQKNYDLAEQILRDALKNNWNLHLIDQYSLAESSRPEKQLEFAETLLKDHEKNASLLLVLGRLAKRCQLWGKARSYLEASLGIEDRIEAYKELGLLLEQLDEKEAAIEYFRKGVMVAAKPTDSVATG